MLISFLILLPLVGVLFILINSMNISVDNNELHKQDGSMLKISALVVTIVDLFVSLLITS